MDCNEIKESVKWRLNLSGYDSEINSDGYIKISSGFDGGFSNMEKPTVDINESGCQMDFWIEIEKAKLFQKSKRDSTIDYIISEAKRQLNIQRCTYRISDYYISFPIVEICSGSQLSDPGKIQLVVVNEIIKYLRFIHLINVGLDSANLK